MEADWTRNEIAIYTKSCLSALQNFLNYFCHTYADFLQIVDLLVLTCYTGKKEEKFYKRR